MKGANDYSVMGNCKIDSSADIKKGAVIGKPFRRLLDGKQEKKGKTVIGKQVYVGFYSLIGARTEIGSHTIIDDFSVIESDVSVGEKSLIIYHGQICNEARIGNNCVIGGLIGERTIVGNNCRIFGKIVHSQNDPSLLWDGGESEEKAVKIKDFAFVAFGAVVAGNITLGIRSYILAGAVITKDIPDFHIACGVNEVIHFSKWRGKKLRQSAFFLEK
jgi:acetyltransferase-like isoleucine patch superfamily enzyme